MQLYVCTNLTDDELWDIRPPIEKKKAINSSTSYFFSPAKSLITGDFYRSSVKHFLSHSQVTTEEASGAKERCFVREITWPTLALHDHGNGFSSEALQRPVGD